MASIYQLDRVKYECSCSTFLPIDKLLFCRYCSEIKCHACSICEIDHMFCPNCLENTAASEARVKKNRCYNCHQCPVCSMVLNTRMVGETSHLACATCRWSTRDSDVPDQANGTQWPVYETTLDKELNQVSDRMRTLAAQEKAQRDREKQYSRRRSNMISGSRLTDRYGLQTIYKNRKKTFEEPQVAVAVHEATDEVPEIDFDKFLDENDEETNIRASVESTIRQPLAGADKRLRPVRMPLRSRKALRCKSCDHNLYKLEYGPSSSKFKLRFFAVNYLPQIMLSREPEMTPGQTNAVLLTVSNESSARCEVMFLPDNESGNVECITEPFQVSLQLPDETADIYYGSVDTEKLDRSVVPECVVFRRRNRAGIRLDVNCAQDFDPKTGVLAFQMKYLNELSKMQGEAEWKICRVRIQLYPSEKTSGFSA